GLLDYDPFEGMIGHLLGVRRTMPLAHKTLLQSHLTLLKSRVIRIDVLQQGSTDDPGFDMNQGRQDRNPERPAQLPHHIIQSRTLTDLGAMKVLDGKRCKRHEQNGHSYPADNQRPEEIT